MAEPDRPPRSKEHSTISSQPHSACRNTFLLQVGNTRHTWSMLLLRRLSSRGKNNVKTSSPKQSFESSPSGAVPFLCEWDWRGVGARQNKSTRRGVNNTRARGRPRVPELQWQHVLLSALSLCVSSHYNSNTQPALTDWLSDWLANGTCYLLLYERQEAGRGGKACITITTQTSLT